ncbi:MAG: ketoacyl-ACP synthase III [Candidatus Brocadiae bacterium]|nr:ketoacyl-ACP synthase III [Candidatus Brocadiia bacterium]
MHTQQRLAVEIAGLGSYLPERILTNSDLEKMVDTSDEWIFPRTGIRERHLLADDEATSDMATAAARTALESAGTAAADLDAIVVATCTPDYFFPATGCLVQAALGAENAMSFDLEAACSGFVFALTWAAGVIASRLAHNVLVIGAEALSRFTDYTDRRSCILFGDAAGAAVLRPAQNGGEFIYAELGSDGSRPNVLITPAGGARAPASHDTVERRDHYMKIQGREVFKAAVNKLTELLATLPERTGVSLDEVKMVIPHQSNVRIINSAFQRAGVDLSKAYMNIDRVGNTSSASIPVAMTEAVERGALERGDLVLFLAFGGGLTWGSVLIRY